MSSVVYVHGMGHGSKLIAIGWCPLATVKPGDSVLFDEGMSG